MKKILLVLVILNLYSCQKNEVERCEELAPLAFRGFPKESNEYKRNCKEVKHELSLDRCQQVLTFFIIKGKKEDVEKQFGEKAAKCLTKNDFEKFGR